MAREPREFVSGAIYHIYSRGSNRQAIFAFDSDRADFLECVSRVVRVYELRCLSYCLMPNHYHLVLQVGDTPLSAAMKVLNGRYALGFNRRYGRDAHLFKNRFGAVLQETESQLFWTLRYTVRNPVEKQLCAQPDEWPWSSYRASVGLDRTPPFLDVRALLSYFGDEVEMAIARYRDMVAVGSQSAGV
ncbi:MAG TPA: transposase [Gaiellaceae bacterium]|jgi:REP element-mobilizing transposase RayT|nr:transposase [Gaiellaceae bacterium]